jgi:lysophospholipase L1-like esterase
VTLGLGSGLGYWRKNSSIPLTVASPNYVGQVVSRTALSTSLAATTQPYMSRKFMVAMENILAIQLVFMNWAVGVKLSQAETASGGVMTATASIEYPAGVFTQVKFGGSATGTAASGANLVSDMTPLNRQIPRGATFWIRDFRSNSVAMPICDNSTTIDGPPQYVAGGDATVTNGTDQTMGGTVADDGTTTQTWPSLVLAATSQATILVVGDSRQVVEVPSVGDASGLAGQAIRALGATFACIRLGVPGDRLAQFIAGSVKRRALAALASPTHVVNMYGINDLAFGGVTAATLVASHQTAREMFADKPYYGATVSPRSTSTDGWATVGNQAAGGESGSGEAFNTLARATPADWTGFVDPAVNDEVGTTWKWNAPLYTTDGLHGTALANQHQSLTVSPTPAYTPAPAIATVIAASRLWLEGKSGVTTVAGPLVTAWLDQSPRALSCTPPTTGLRPTTSTSINGKACVSFNGSTALGVPSAVWSGAKVIVMVAKLNNAATAGQVALCLVDSGAVGQNLLFFNSAGFKKVSFIADEPGTSAHPSSGYDVTLDTAAHSYYITYDGGTYTTPGSYRATQGDTFVPVASGNIGAVASAVSGIGGLLNASNTLFNGANFDVALVAVFARSAFTPALRAATEAYIASEYGV